MKITIFGLNFIVEREHSKDYDLACKILDFAVTHYDFNDYRVIKVPLAKALRVLEPELGLLDAKTKVESLFDFTAGGQNAVIKVK